MTHTEAVIFDWAGTTVDFGCMAPLKAMQTAFAEHEIEVSLDAIRKPMGLAKFDHIKLVLLNLKPDATDEEAQAIYNAFERSIMANLQNFADLIPGILEVQEYLRSREIRIGSTTGYTKAMIKIVSGEARKKGYVPDCIITPEHVSQGRPHPFMLQQNMLRMGLHEKSRIIKVGDTIADILEGVNAGCWSIGVVRGSSMLGLSAGEIEKMAVEEYKQRCERIKNEMHAAGAHFVLENISELPDIIKTIEESQL